MPSGKSRHHSSVGKKPFHIYRTRHNQLESKREKIHRDMKRKLKEDGLIADKTPAVWEWCYGGEHGTVKCHTKSEARGMIKKLLKIPKKKRLPRDVHIQKVEFNGPST